MNAFELDIICKDRILDLLVPKTININEKGGSI